MQTREIRVGFEPQSAPVGPESGISIGDLLRMLGAHAWFILLCSVLGLAASVIYARLQAPVYEASATIRLDPGRASSLGLGDAGSGASGDADDAFHTESAIIKSDAVAIQTLNSLNSQDFRNFASFAKDPVPIPDNSEALSSRQENLIERLEANTTVSQEEGTQLIQVKFRDRDPHLAATMANGLVGAYTVQNFTSRDKSVAQLRTWLSAQMQSLKDKVEASQRRLAEFQQANNIITTVGAGNTITDRLALLNDKLTEAQATRITKEAQLRAASTGNASTLASLFPNPKLQELQTEQGTLFSQYAQMSTKFGEKYSPLVDIRKQLQLIDAEIDRSVQTVRSQLKQEYDAAVNTQTMLQSEYDQQAKLAYGLNRNQAEYAELQAEVNSSRELYDTLQSKLQQAAVDTQVNSVEMVVVDSARAPLRPIAPKKTFIVLCGLTLGLFVGLASAFFFESSSDRVRSSDQIEKALGCPALAALAPHRIRNSKSLPPDTGQSVPLSAVRSPLSLSLNASPAPVISTDSGVRNDATAQKIGLMAPLIALREPLSRSAEDYRALRSALLSTGNGQFKTISFVSTMPGEDLDVVAANFAVSLAQTGARVLLVDADLRKPSLHEHFGRENGPGLGDYLSDSAATTHVKIPIRQLSNLSLVTSGEMPLLPCESLASDRFSTLLAQWSDSFDYVVIKTAPLLMVTDGFSVAARADTTVLVAKYHVSRLDDVIRARKMLTQNKVNLCGFVLNGVPKTADRPMGLKSHAKEYYAQS